MRTVNKLLVAVALLSAFSCVSTKKFNTMQGTLTGENNQLKQQVAGLTTQSNEFRSLSDRLQNQNKELTAQIDKLAYDQEILSRTKDALEREKSNLEKQFTTLKTGTSSEIERLINDLNQREAKLKESEIALQDKNARLIELQEALRLKEEAVAKLKKKVAEALVGFQNNGLTVFEKNGKVYVSLEERLLFKTGQWDVDPKGQQALRDLGAVLAQNADINVMVEGHTDDVPMRSPNQVKDNWDLSVMRATAVTKVLLQNKLIDPVRIISAGRSEFLPLDQAKTTEARQKNRRTEIILTPKLDELLQLIENN